MNGPWQGFVCGFGDLEAGAGGLAWDLGDPGAMVLLDGQPHAATFAIEEGGDAAVLELAAEGASVEATLTPEAATVALPGAAGGLEINECVAEVRPKGGSKTVRCEGEIGRWSGDALDGAASFRYLAIEHGDAILIATAKGQAGAAGHGEEETSAWVLRDEQATPFEEAFISTQYDGEGNPTRIGLELWAEDADQSSRAAATRVAGSLVGGVKLGDSWAGQFRCHTDGTEGRGSYLLWRA